MCSLFYLSPAVKVKATIRKWTEPKGGGWGRRIILRRQTRYLEFQGEMEPYPKLSCKTFLYFFISIHFNMKFVHATGITMLHYVARKREKVL